MANPEHLEILKQGVGVWNQWREENSEILPNLDGIDFRNMNLSKCDFRMTILSNADLSGCNLHKANFHGADLTETNLSEAKLSGANFCRTDLYRSNLSRADLSSANLKGSQLAETNLSGAILVGCEVYGSSAWDLKLDNAVQQNLIIGHKGNSKITVDNLEIAQFIYLLLHNHKIRNVIDTVGKKAVLILGRFTAERKAVLDAIREELRRRDYIPILFDFDKPAGRDLTETISTLAHLSRFIIADITDAKSIPQELQAIVPNLPSVAVQPIIHIADQEYGMFEHFRKYPWVLPPYHYQSQDQLIQALGEFIINPAEVRVRELRSIVD